MILVVTEGDPWRTFGLIVGWLIGEVTGECDSGGVLVELIEFDGELADGVCDECGEQTGSVGSVKVIECGSDAVVVEEFELLGKESEVLGNATECPLVDGVERLSCDDKVGEEHVESQRCGQGGSSSGELGEMLLEESCELESLEEMVNDGSGPDFEGFE